MNDLAGTEIEGAVMRSVLGQGAPPSGPTPTWPTTH